ncbi:MAG: esterase-like activity of phytase family protein [Cyanobacteria bacterium P01_C01_bin.72]
MSDRWKGFIPRFSISLLTLSLLLSLASCSLPERVTAEERMFRDLSLEFIDQVEIPKEKFQDTLMGGLSAISYNREQDVFYVLSDDRSKRDPARFYTFKLEIEQNQQQQIKIASFKPQNVTLLLNDKNNKYKKGKIDPEGIAISPRNSVYISSEGNASKGIDPFIAEYELATGKKVSELRIPQRYLTEEKSRGIQDNSAFESLTINLTGLPEDPFRVFAATEDALLQDESFEGEEQARIRFLHYLVNPVGEPIVVAEHLYMLEPAPIEVIAIGLTELLALPTEGYFLSLERSYGFTGAGAKIFQVVVGNATDTSNIESMRGDLGQLQPLRKELLLDLADLGIYLDNLEGMTLGPRLPDGSRSLLLVSDDNFKDDQISQLLLFRLNEDK